MLTYGTQYFLVVFAISVGLALLTGIPALILYCRQKKQDEDNEDEDLYYEEMSHSPRYTILCLTISSTVFFSVFLVSLGTFYYYPWWVGACTITLIGALEAFFTRDWFIKSTIHEKSIPPIIALLFLMTSSIIFIWFISFFFSNICIGYHPDTITFTGTRLNSRDRCPDYAPGPCHVYLLMGEDLSTQVMVVFHASLLYVRPMVWVGRDPNGSLDFFVKFPAEHYFFRELEGLVPRFIYYGFVSGLVPGTTYYFVVGDAGNIRSLTKIKKFRTGPSDGSNFTFGVGGDVGNEHPFPDMSTQQVASHEPLFLAIGGDIAYDNGLPGCYQLWDAILWMFQDNLVSPSGYTIPLLFSIGNHEAGVDWGSYRKHDAPFYFSYLPHEPLNGRQPMDLNTYRTHKIGNNTVIYILDSQILLTAESQVPWFRQQLIQDSSVANKFALYHIPTHPVIRDPTLEPMVTINNTWTPLFDEYNLKIAFENHDHAFVRSHFLKNGTIAEDGTLYIGDGAFGVVSDLGVDSLSRPYVAVARSVRHFMVVDVVGSNVTVTTITYEGTVIDVVSKQK